MSTDQELNVIGDILAAVARGRASGLEPKAWRRISDLTIRVA